jgi:hypothetical protein
MKLSRHFHQTPRVSTLFVSSVEHQKIFRTKVVHTESCTKPTGSAAEALAFLPRSYTRSVCGRGVVHCLVMRVHREQRKIPSDSRPEHRAICLPRSSFTYSTCAILYREYVIPIPSSNRKLSLVNVQLKYCPKFISSAHTRRPSRLFRRCTTIESSILLIEPRTQVQVQAQQCTAMHVSLASSAVRCETRHPELSCKRGGILSSCVPFLPCIVKLICIFLYLNFQTGHVNLTSSVNSSHLHNNPFGVTANWQFCATPSLEVSRSTMP